MKKVRWVSSGLFRAAPQAEDLSFLTNRFFAALLCVTQEKSAQSGAKKLCLGALVFLCGAAKGETRFLRPCTDFAAFSYDEESTL